MIQLTRDSCGYLVTDLDTGADLFVQTDWDFPGLAASFGGILIPRKGCYHHGTDGTIDCKGCGKTASEFIAEATEFLDDNDGATAEDPGYFGG